MAWWQWSKTAASNSTADPTINLAEGMSPSSVNDSARASMARTADFRDLISGKLVTTGSATALALATGQTPVFDTLAHMDGAMFAFTPNVQNSGPVTLAVDGLAAKPIRSSTGANGNLAAGALMVATPYVVTYNDAAGEFILQGLIGIPIGGIFITSVIQVANSNFIQPIGQAVSRQVYVDYFTLVGTTFGAGDGVTTFNVPNLSTFIVAPLKALLRVF